MVSVGAYEAKTRLAELLEQVARGERITITKHGKPVALLSPVDPVPSPDVRSVIREIKQFRAGRKLDGLSIRQMVEEGRR